MRAMRCDAGARACAACDVIQTIFGPGSQAGGDALEQKRAVFLLRTLAAQVAGRPDVATLLDLYESLGDFAVFSVEVRSSPIRKVPDICTPPAL